MPQRLNDAFAGIPPRDVTAGTVDKLFHFITRVTRACSVFGMEAIEHREVVKMIARSEDDFRPER